MANCTPTFSEYGIMRWNYRPKCGSVITDAK